VRGRPALRGGHAALSPDDRELYVTSAAYDSDSVLTFSRDPATGALSQLPGADGCISEHGDHGCGRLPWLDKPAKVAVSPDGAWTYVAAREGTVAIFSRRPCLTGRWREAR
jgi:DNA-binding beta-propeller fold protein YncE